jgi:hypothetical protein
MMPRSSNPPSKQTPVEAAVERMRRLVIAIFDYLEALYAAVRDGMIAGTSLETLQDEIRLDECSDLKNYAEWLRLNVAGVYRTLADQSYMLKRPDTAAPGDPR